MASIKELNPKANFHLSAMQTYLFSRVTEVDASAKLSIYRLMTTLHELYKRI